MGWLLLASISALLLGIWTLLMKRDVMHESRTQVIALYPLVAAVGLALFADIDYRIILTGAAWLLFVKSTIVALAIYCHTLALKRLPVSIYAPMANLSPIFLLATSSFLLGELIGARQVAGLLITLTGAMLLDVDMRKIRHQLPRFLTNRAIIVLLLGGFVISFSPIMDRLLLRITTPETVLFYFSLMLSLYYWIIHWLRKRELPTQGLNLREGGWILLTGLVILFADLTYLEAIAVPGTLLVLIVGIRRLSTLFATLLGGKLLHEENIAYKSAVCLVMVLGTILLVS